MLISARGNFLEMSLTRHPSESTDLQCAAASSLLAFVPFYDQGRPGLGTVRGAVGNCGVRSRGEQLVATPPLPSPHLQGPQEQLPPPLPFLPLPPLAFSTLGSSWSWDGMGAFLLAPILDPRRS